MWPCAATIPVARDLIFYDRYTKRNQRCIQHGNCSPLPARERIADKRSAAVSALRQICFKSFSKPALCARLKGSSFTAY